MTNFLRYHGPFIALLGVLTVYFLWGVPLVPFHPDESTQIFMSSDLDLLLSDPLSLAWDPSKEDDLKQQYRTLDAPLTRYLLGIGRRLFSLAPLAADWDWSKNWSENLTAGAFPESRLLSISRATITVLLPLSLVFLYLSGKEIGGRSAGFLSAFLLGTHSLTLVHARRAMAEGALLFGVSLFLWSLTQRHKRPWAVGFAAAVAFNAKQSAGALLPVGLVAVLWDGELSPANIKQRVINLGVYLLTFGIITLALNPIVWKKPIQSIEILWNSRQTLLDQQTASTESLAPNQVLHNPMQRSLALLANIYILPPSFYEIGNYQADTEQSEARYIATPGHKLMRGPVLGGISLLLTIFGILLSALFIRRSTAPTNRLLALYLFGGFLQGLALMITIPLPWQRFVTPLLPFVSLWMAFGLSKLGGELFGKLEGVYLGDGTPGYTPS
jgi:4-amino-4-deoxy-L-arabinose transferase-like glycosyltransferase